MRTKPWHAPALKLYVDEEKPLRQVHIRLQKMGFKLTNIAVRHFLVKSGVYRVDMRRGWAKVKYTPKSCEMCHKEYAPSSRTQRWCKECCPDQRAMFLLMTYGIGIEDMKRYVERASGRCEICKQAFDDDKVKMNIDHCHSTGQVRGLLCTACNLTLGACEKNPAWLANACAYLDRAKNT